MTEAKRSRSSIRPAEPMIIETTDPNEIERIMLNRAAHIVRSLGVMTIGNLVRTIEDRSQGRIYEAVRRLIDKELLQAPAFGDAHRQFELTQKGWDTVGGGVPIWLRESLKA